MKTIQVSRVDIDLDAYKKRGASENDYAEFIDESCLIYEDNALMIAYLELNADCSELVSALHQVKYEKGSRTSGMPSQSAIFGYSPRNTIRKDFCSATRLAYDQPHIHQVIVDYAQVVADEYQKINPDLHDEHMATTRNNVVGDYRVKESPFTSGIINKNNPLKYHFDSGNFSGVWSGMLVFKGGVSGGYLSVPEYNMGFKLRHNSLLMFDGQGLLHGVTPIRKLSSDAYRYSIVYYSLRQMWNCLPLDDELLRIRKLKTERERNRGTSKGNP